MSTPEGWALSNMWYDTAAGRPEHQSPQETLYMLVYLNRTQTTLLATRALVQTSLPNTKEAQTPAVEAFQTYYDAIYPFLESAASPENDEMHKALEAFTKVTSAAIPLKPIWQNQADAGRRAIRRRKAMALRAKKK